MKKPTIFLFRSPSGEIRSASGECADQAANKLGRVLSWDAELDTLDLVRHGRTERWTYTGDREEAHTRPRRKSLSQLRRLFGVRVAT